MEKSSVIMDRKAIERAIVRISHEIIERNKGIENLVLIGIKRRGISIAKCIQTCIERFEGKVLPFGELDIKFYRDDLVKENIDPSFKGYKIDFSIENKTIILVDDVIYTGRTARAAIDQIMDISRPSCIQLAVLVDRGHRELPIRPDYVGKNLPTSKREIVKLSIPPYDDTWQLVIKTKEEEC